MAREPSRLKAFDLAQLAPNGLRRGYTTGTCATAAVKAALHMLLHEESLDRAAVSLPDGEHFLVVPIESVVATPPWVCAFVRKEAGDDPDQTHGARIFARVRHNELGRIVFKRGAGVGLVTQPGLPVPVGEPAINPVPRAMIRHAVEEMLETDGMHSPDASPESGDTGTRGFDIEIGCENGEEIARRTFNPRLGIEGGISILGTTGIVEPKSLASFKAAIEVYIRVALADAAAEVVLSPGNLGQKFARKSLDLPLKRIVQMSNFAGFAIDFLRSELEHQGRTLERLWVVGHPGKLCKILLDEWDTHSSRSSSAVPAVAAMAEHIAQPGMAALCEDAPSVEAVIERLGKQPDAPQLWAALEDALNRRIHSRAARVARVHTVLFSLDGRALSAPQG